MNAALLDNKRNDKFNITASIIDDDEEFVLIPQMNAALHTYLRLTYVHFMLSSTYIA